MLLHDIYRLWNFQCLSQIPQYDICVELEINEEALKTAIYSSSCLQALPFGVQGMHWGVHYQYRWLRQVDNWLIWRCSTIVCHISLGATDPKFEIGSIPLQHYFLGIIWKVYPSGSICAQVLPCTCAFKWDMANFVPQGQMMNSAPKDQLGLAYMHNICIYIQFQPPKNQYYSMFVNLSSSKLYFKGYLCHNGEFSAS